MEHISQPIARILDELAKRQTPPPARHVRHPGDLAEQARFLRLKSRRAELVREIKEIDSESGRIVLGHSLVEVGQ